MDLSQIKLPTWLMPTTKQLMELAEDLFGPGTGASKKAWVRTALLDAARQAQRAAQVGGLDVGAGGSARLGTAQLLWFF